MRMSAQIEAPIQDQFFTERPRANKVAFYYKMIRNNFKSKKLGKEIFEPKPYILIVCPGQRQNEFRGPVQDVHKREYRAEWEAFIANKAPPAAGTPLQKLGGVNPEQIQLLQFINIDTIEQLASVSDLNLSNIGMGGLDLRTRARAFLAANGGTTTALQAEVSEMKAQLAAVLAQNARLIAKLGVHDDADTSSSDGAPPDVAEAVSAVRPASPDPAVVPAGRPRAGAVIPSDDAGSDESPFFDEPDAGRTA